MLHVRFMCSVCFAQNVVRARGFSSEKQKQEFKQEVDAHQHHHRVARAHKDFHEQCATQYPMTYAMFLLDGTPGPSFSSFASGAVPAVYSTAVVARQRG